MLGAEVEGRLLAAISLADGAVVADPFSPTGELADLLELRIRAAAGAAPEALAVAARARSVTSRGSRSAARLRERSSA